MVARGLAAGEGRREVGVAIKGKRRVLLVMEVLCLDCISVSILL